MAKVSSSSSAAEDEEIAGASPTFEKLRELLKAKDDTSRFVGLALLKSLLDNGQLAQHPEQLLLLWQSISPRFLDRLLRAQHNENAGQEEATNMVDLAVSVLHTFTILLPEDSRCNERLTGRTESLVRTLSKSTPETTNLTLQTLLIIVSVPEGALNMLSIQDWTPMIEISPQNPLVLDIFLFTWTNAAILSQKTSAVQTSIDSTLSSLLDQFQKTDAVMLVSFVVKLLRQLPPDVFSLNPQWLKPLVSVMCILVLSRPNAASRAAYTQLAASLLQIYPAMALPLLFGRHAEADADSKPFSYLFINLILIDLRASFPSLLSQINSSEYPAISQRLVAAFDIVSSFIGRLVQSLDADSIQYELGMPPDLLLKLRKDIAETVSLTIEYLRDRWDASVAGASGLHTSARSGAATTSEGSRLTLTWDSKTNNVDSDPLILAGIRTLAIWIREDENENLRNEAAAVMDMFIELYKMSGTGAMDFRYPILLALESVLFTEDAVESFLAQDGWQVLFEDLKAILLIAPDNARPPSSSSPNARSLEIVRVLLTVVDHPSITFPREAWLSAINTTTSIRLPPSVSDPLYLELQIAAVQLSTALLAKSAVGVQKMYIDSIVALSGLAHRLDTLASGLDDKTEASELSSLLQDVFLDLHNLRSSMV